MMINQEEYRKYLIEYLNLIDDKYPCVKDINNLMNFHKWSERNCSTSKIKKIDYANAYLDYVKSFIDDKNVDLSTMEDFDSWVNEEIFEKKIRCSKCDSFNTIEHHGKKVCEDCKDETEITKDNFGNM